MGKPGAGLQPGCPFGGRPTLAGQQKNRGLRMFLLTYCCGCETLNALPRPAAMFIFFAKDGIMVANSSKSSLPPREVHRRLVGALNELERAQRNAVLWFSEVVRRKIYRELGYSSIYQYAELELGFMKAKTAQFLRLCESFKELPEAAAFGGAWRALLDQGPGGGQGGHGRDRRRVDRPGKDCAAPGAGGPGGGDPPAGTRRSLRAPAGKPGDGGRERGFAGRVLLEGGTGDGTDAKGAVVVGRTSTVLLPPLPWISTCD